MKLIRIHLLLVRGNDEIYTFPSSSDLNMNIFYNNRQVVGVL